MEDDLDDARSQSQARPERLRAGRAAAPRRAAAHVDPRRIRPAALLARIRQHRPAAAASGRSCCATECGLTLARSAKTPRAPRRILKFRISDLGGLGYLGERILRSYAPDQSLRAS